MATSLDLKTVLFIEWKIHFLERLKVAGNAFRVGSRDHGSDQCRSDGVRFVSIHSKRKQIPMWLSSKPFTNSFKAHAQPCTTSKICGL